MNILNKLKQFSYTKSQVPRKPPLGFRRSPEWRRVRDEFINENDGKCAACGLKTNLEVHHIIPLRLNRALELDKSNLIVLCENKSIFCHFVTGHSFSWWSYNPYVRQDAALLQERIRDRLP